MSDSSANKFKGSVYLARKLELGVQIGGYVLGGLLVLVGLFFAGTGGKRCVLLHVDCMLCVHSSAVGRAFNSGRE